VSAAILQNRDIEVVKGDIVRGEGLKEAARGIHTAYYLVHSMGSKSMFKSTEFAGMDKDAAKNFISSADEAGIKRVIYLGGLGETGKSLSEHLRSREEVAEILSAGKLHATILRYRGRRRILCNAEISCGTASCYDMPEVDRYKDSTYCSKGRPGLPYRMSA